LIAAQFFATLAGPITAITQLSLRQSLIPHELQGRVNGTMRFIVAGLVPLGALLGGAIGERFGLWPTIMIAAAGIQLGFVRLLFSPVQEYQETGQLVAVPES
jgi:hypothetical protein